ncbi:hypothetical protein VNO77_03401 [Canavalia gladiata]|uniref:Uncharacterized protein n=1 Tax=Canavalia gladiata TaxID=3824 RepID=A0AAN9MZM4_CANGL
MIGFLAGIRQSSRSAARRSLREWSDVDSLAPLFLDARSSDHRLVGLHPVWGPVEHTPCEAASATRRCGGCLEPKDEEGAWNLKMRRCLEPRDAEDACTLEMMRSHIIGSCNNWFGFGFLDALEWKKYHTEVMDFVQMAEGNATRRDAKDANVFHHLDAAFQPSILPLEIALGQASATLQLEPADSRPVVDNQANLKSNPDSRPVVDNQANLKSNPAMSFYLN